MYNTQYYAWSQTFMEKYNKILSKMYATNSAPKSATKSETKSSTNIAIKSAQ